MTVSVAPNPAPHVPTVDESPTVPLVLAGAACGLGRSASYDAHKAGKLPFPVLEIGGKYRVPTAALRRLLELDAPASS
jgi:hypothetical protein